MIATPLARLAVVSFSFASFALAQTPHWPHWRGPTEDGHAAEDANPPLTWSESENIVWKVALPGLGNSSPIILGDRIYLTGAIDLEAAADGEEPGPQPGPPTANRHEFFVMAIDRNDGSIVWRTKVHEGVPPEKGHETGSHASGSIATDGEHLAAFFGSEGLYVLDLEGELQWSKQLGTMETLAHFGEGASPIVYGDRVIVQWDAEGPSWVAAFDLATGEEAWRQERDTDSSWGTPLVADVEGTDQLIVTGSDHTVGYAAASGEPLWSCGGMSKNPINSPLVVDGILYVMNAYKGRLVQAIDLASASGTLDPDSDLLWGTKGLGAEVPPPIHVDGRLFYLRDNNAVLECADAATGESIYSGQRLRGLRNIHASPIYAAGRLYFTSREGKVVVMDPGAEFKVLATNSLDDGFDATPAFVGDRIYLRGRSHLYCIGEQP